MTEDPQYQRSQRAPGAEAKFFHPITIGPADAFNPNEKRSDGPLFEKAGPSARDVVAFRSRPAGRTRSARVG